MKVVKKISTIFIVVILALSCSKKGCTDPTAANYDPEAEKDDGCDYSYTVPSNYEFTD